jgi:DNA-binding beta-propeller fold protein YncE
MPARRGDGRAWRRGAPTWLAAWLAWSVTTGCSVAGITAAPDAAARTTAALGPIAAQPADRLVDVTWRSDGAPDALRLPTGLVLDGRGRLWVMDVGHDRVRALPGAGEPGAQWGGYGGGPGQFRFRSLADGYRPVESSVILGGGIAADARGRLYVADPLNARIQVFDPSGRLLAVWGDGAVARDLFRQPAGLAVGDDGAVYVADSGSHRVLKLDGDGRLLLAWGGPGGAEGELRWPMAVAAGRQGPVYVADGGNARIQQFDRAGRFVRAWGGPGAAAGEFGGPVFLAVDGQGRVYAGDYANHRVQVFSGDGHFLAQWGRQGGGDGEFAYVGGVAVDGRGDVYVADIGNGRIQRFRPRAAWPSPTDATPTPRPAPPTPALAAPPRLTPTDR